MFKRTYNHKLFYMCLFAYVSSYLLRYNYSACLTNIMAEFAIDKTFAGAVSTGYLACYGVGQLLNGFLGEKIHPRIMIFTGLAGAGAANILMGLNRTPSMLLVIWCFNGYFNSMLWASIIKCFAEWMNEKAAKKAALNIATSIPMGMVLSFFISSLCLKYINWRSNFLIVGAWGIIAAFIWFVCLGRMKEETERRSLRRVISEEKGQTAVLKSPGFFRLLVVGGLLFATVGIFFNGVLKDGIAQWIPTYLIEEYKISPSFASASSIIFAMINLSGAYIAAYFNKKLKDNEMKTSALMFAFSLGALIILRIFNGKSLVIAIAAISISIASMYGANTMITSYIPLRFNSIGRSSTVTGFFDACSYLASAVSTVVMGSIAENSGWNALLLMWVAVAAGGLAVCAAGITVWARKRNLYTEGHND